MQTAIWTIALDWKGDFDKRMPITEHSESALPLRAPWNVQACLPFQENDMKKRLALRKNLKRKKNFSVKAYLSVWPTMYIWSIKGRLGGKNRRTIRTTSALCQSCLWRQWIVTKQSFIFQENRWCRLKCFMGHVASLVCSSGVIYGGVQPPRLWRSNGKQRSKNSL